MKSIKLRIYADGKIEAKTQGVKGKACLDYITILEKLTGAVTVDSEFTQEYRQADEQQENTAENEVDVR